MSDVFCPLYAHRDLRRGVSLVLLHRKRVVGIRVLSVLCRSIDHDLQGIALRLDRVKVKDKVKVRG